jgi:hypothetical protein
MTEQNCLNCRFWHIELFYDEADEADEDFRTECRRFPPQIYEYDRNTLDINTAQPETSGGDWCGEWQARP